MEKFLNKLERKFGRYAIPNLMLYIIILYALGFALSLFVPEAYYSWFALDAKAILRGQVWRIITFIIQPPDTNIFFVIFTLYLYYMIGVQLERAWGSFRFNMYFFTGVLLHVVAAFIAYAISGMTFLLGTEYLNLSLFLAFAALYPNFKLYIFGIIPIKMKWLAIIDVVLFAWPIVMTIVFTLVPLIIGAVYGVSTEISLRNIGPAIASIVSILNFLIFYFGMRSHQRMTPQQKQRRKEYKKAVQETMKTSMSSGARHRCTVCGRTELDDPNLEFRYCSKCNGNYEYCQEHLFTHEHIK